jgi:hypothetical protein
LNQNQYDQFENVDAVPLQNVHPFVLLLDVVVAFFEPLLQPVQPLLQLLGVHVEAVFEAVFFGLPRRAGSSQLIEPLFFLLDELQLQTFQLVILALQSEAALLLTLHELVDQPRKLH